MLTFTESIQNNKKDLILAARKAIIGHRKKREVREFEKNFDAEIERLMASLRDGSWEEIVCEYREWIGKNPSPNGKTRLFREPSLRCRILQHLLIRVLMPWYITHDNYNGLNCKFGCGILSSQKNNKRNISRKNHRKFIKTLGYYDPEFVMDKKKMQNIPYQKRRTVLNRLKHIFYDRRDLHWALVIDQRKCYMHIRPALFRKTLRDILGITRDPKFLHFALMTVYGRTHKQHGLFRNAGLPIGTPTSPLAHHLCMLTFDKWVTSGDLCVFPHASVRYADDNLIAFQSKKDANEAKWRIYNYWWYVLGIRAKTCTTRIINLDKTDSQGLDFCGFVYHRNPGKKIYEHNKGFVRLRKNTLERILQHTKKGKYFRKGSFASYFGRLICADEWHTIMGIEKNIPDLKTIILPHTRKYDMLGGKSYRFMPFKLIWRYYGNKKNVSILDYESGTGMCALRFRIKKRTRYFITHLCAENNFGPENRLKNFLKKFCENNYTFPLWNIPCLKKIA